MESQRAVSLFRIVRSNPPTEADFWSRQRLGIPLVDPTKHRIWIGVSTFQTWNAANSKALVYPDKGAWIAELHAPHASGVIRFKQTGRPRDRHVTVWAEPEILLAAVVFVTPVRRG